MPSVRRGQSWADALFAPRTDVMVYYQLTLWEESDAPCLVTASIIGHPLPAGLADASVNTTLGLSLALGAPS